MGAARKDRKDILEANIEQQKLIYLFAVTQSMQQQIINNLNTTYNFFDYAQDKNKPNAKVKVPKPEKKITFWDREYWDIYKNRHQAKITIAKGLIELCEKTIASIEDVFDFIHQFETYKIQHKKLRNDDSRLGKIFSKYDHLSDLKEFYFSTMEKGDFSFRKNKLNILLLRHYFLKLEEKKLALEIGYVEDENSPYDKNIGSYHSLDLFLSIENCYKEEINERLKEYELSDAYIEAVKNYLEDASKQQRIAFHQSMLEKQKVKIIKDISNEVSLQFDFLAENKDKLTLLEEYKKESIENEKKKFALNSRIDLFRPSDSNQFEKILKFRADVLFLIDELIFAEKKLLYKIAICMRQKTDNSYARAYLERSTPYTCGFNEFHLFSLISSLKSLLDVDNNVGLMGLDDMIFSVKELIEKYQITLNDLNKNANDPNNFRRTLNITNPASRMDAVVYDKERSLQEKIFIEDQKVTVPRERKTFFKQGADGDYLQADAAYLKEWVKEAQHILDDFLKEKMKLTFIKFKP